MVRRAAKGRARWPALLATAAALLAGTAEASLPTGSSRSDLLEKPALTAALANAEQADKPRAWGPEFAGSGIATLAAYLEDRGFRVLDEPARHRLATGLSASSENQLGAEKPRFDVRLSAHFAQQAWPRLEVEAENLASGVKIWEPEVNVRLLRCLASISWQRAASDHRARFYDPQTQTFLEPDPLGPVDSPNLYQAFSLDGFNVTDPFGLLTPEEVVERLERMRRLREEQEAADKGPGFFAGWFGGMRATAGSWAGRVLSDTAGKAEEAKTAGAEVVGKAARLAAHKAIPPAAVDPHRIAQAQEVGISGPASGGAAGAILQNRARESAGDVAQDLGSKGAYLALTVLESKAIEGAGKLAEEAAEAKRMPVGPSGHHVPSIRKSLGRPFEVGRADKARPTVFSRGVDPGYDHWRMHEAERPFVGPRVGDFKGTDDELFDAYRKAYKGLDDIRVDVKAPTGGTVLAENVSPRQAVDVIDKWLQMQGKR